MINDRLMEILRCPACVSQPHAADADPGRLDVVAEGQWLICQDCGRKYPVVQNIPVMLIEVGTRWQETPRESLPVPPPPVNA